MPELKKSFLLLLVLISPSVVATGETSSSGEWIELFNGEDLTGWHLRDPSGPNGWTVQNGVYINTPPSTDIMTNEDYYDFELHVEFRIAEDGNSGVYLRDRYEVQLFDSYGKAPSEEGCGALFRRAAPKVNASKPAGEWQTVDIRFIGKHLTVHQNGTLVLDIEDVGPRGTGSSSHREDAPGPLRLQGDHDQVSFRNIRIRPL